MATSTKMEEAGIIPHYNASNKGATTLIIIIAGRIIVNQRTLRVGGLYDNASNRGCGTNGVTSVGIDKAKQDFRSFIQNIFSWPEGNLHQPKGLP
jgi:hypothetical protein